MPRGSWSAKDERQYEAIRSSCMQKGAEAARRLASGCELCAKKRRETCTKIAAATVNKGKAQRGETRTFGRHCPRGTVPLKGNKTRCYDRSTHRSVARTP